MNSLPEHGRISCALCHKGQTFEFDRTRTELDGWRITNNPLAWGNPRAEIVVLGFSKGPTQAGALGRQPHEEIAFRGGRGNLAKILHHLDLLPTSDARLVDHAIRDRLGRFHFGSLVRCTVERYDTTKGDWLGTGGGMLDKFVNADFGKAVISRCSTAFLRDLPSETKLVLMLGMGSKGNYVRACRQVFEATRPGPWTSINEIAYTDGRVVVVHTEHFASQGALLPNWLSGDCHERGRFGKLALEASRVAFAG